MREEGQGMAEYVLILFLVALAVVVVLTLIQSEGDNVTVFSQPQFEELSYVSEPVRVRSIQFGMRNKSGTSSDVGAIFLIADPDLDGRYNVYYVDPKTDIVYIEEGDCVVVFDSASKVPTLRLNPSGC